MNEQDFRSALRDTMATQVAPPPMSDAPVLEAAHRDRKRRRAMWAGVGSAAAVVAVAVGVAVLAPSGPGDGGVQVGGQPPAPTSGSDVPDATGSASPGDTKTSWPNGQTDRTATSGTQYERGATLADKLTEVIPAGYESPDLDGTGEITGSLKYHQANYEDTVNGVEQWDYMAYAPVTKGEGVGQLLVEVHTPGSATGDGCGIQPALWGMAGTCAEASVDGKRVAVVDITGDDRFDQWAGYRHADGTVVYVAQARSYTYSGKPALDGLPFTGEQLAALAADPRFKVV